MSSLLATRSSAMQPGQRGEKSCLCSGRIQKTNGDRFLVRPHHEIDHPDAWKRHGTIFLDASDVCAEVELKVGNIVVFYLYADEHGLCAEGCNLKNVFVMKLTEAPLWLLDDSDDEEEFKGVKATSETNSTACASEEEASSEDEGSENDSAEPHDYFDLPSKGSALHASGLCKPCGFFMWGCCTKGKDCNHCHCRHTSRFDCQCEGSDSD